MNKKIKLLIIAAAVVLMCLFVASCSQEDVFGKYDEEGYKVTVRYDANGGYFGNAGQLYVNDTYNLGKYRVNENGMKEIRLIDLNDPSRGKANMYPLETASRAGYFHAGWYTEKAELKDENGNVVKDDLGNVVYTYSGKIRFPQTIEIDPKKQYSAGEPAITVYAAWVRCPEVEVYEKVNGVDVLLGKYEVSNPLYKDGDKIVLPSRNMETGALMFNTLAPVGDFIERTAETVNGQTITRYFDGFYLDSERQNGISGTYKLPFVLNEETATIENRTLKLYTGYEEMVGEWYKIYTPSQLEEYASSTGSYEIMADLNFEDNMWPVTFTDETYTGTFKGNGHTIKNLMIYSSGNQHFGLFAGLSAEAVVENVTFDRVEAEISDVYIYPGGRYALFAAVIEPDKNGQIKSFENVNITNSKLIIYASAYAMETNDYEVGLLCADGYSIGLGIDISGISYEIYSEEYDLHILKITEGADGNKLELEFVLKYDE